MKARIKSNGKIVEIVSRFMPKKRNVPSRNWVCNLSDGTCIDESQLEYIDAPEGLEEAAEKYRRDSCNKAMLPNIDGPTPEYGGSIKDAFKAGAEWREKQIPKLPEGLEEAAREYAKIPGKAQHEWYDGGKLEGFKAGAAWRDAQIPKLPDDVDEAMDIIPRKLLIENKESYTFDSTGMRFPKDCFKAGAKWVAEHRIELTWEDVQMLDFYCMECQREEREEKDKYPNAEAFFSEVLRRFNEK